MLDIIFDVRNTTLDVKVRTDKATLFNALMLPQCYLYLQDDNVKYNETFPFRLHLVVLTPHSVYWWLGAEVDVVWRFSPLTSTWEVLKDRHGLAYDLNRRIIIYNPNALNSFALYSPKQPRNKTSLLTHITTPSSMVLIFPSASQKNVVVMYSPSSAV